MANFGNNFITVYGRTASEDIAPTSEIITGWSTRLGNPSGFALSVSFTAISTLSEWAQIGHGRPLGRWRPAGHQTEQAAISGGLKADSYP